MKLYYLKDKNSNKCFYCKSQKSATISWIHMYYNPNGQEEWSYKVFLKNISKNSLRTNKATFWQDTKLMKDYLRRLNDCNKDFNFIIKEIEVEL